MNNENVIRSVAVKIIDEIIDELPKLKITVEALDPVTQSGLEFFAGRAGQTIEEFCLDAVLQRLESDECDIREDDSHFASIRREIAA
jgi:hypothetical protein